VFNRARGDDDCSHGTKFRTYVHINPYMTVFPMYVGKVLSIPDRDRVYDTRLRLSSHKLAIQTGRWSRIRREDRLCPYGVIQTEEHVICHCPLSDHIRSQYGTVSFSNIAVFFDCAEVDVVCRICHLILSMYD